MQPPSCMLMLVAALALLLQPVEPLSGASGVGFSGPPRDLTLSNTPRDLTLSNTLGDNMVLKHGNDARVWGWAPVGTVVTTIITPGNISLQTTSSGDAGLWRQQLPAHAAGLQSYTIVFTAQIRGAVQERSLSNVVFGEVVFCSGQSNMEFTVNSAVNASAEVAAADGYPWVRVVSGPEQNVDTLNTADVFNHTHNQLYYQRLNWSVATNQSIGCADGSCRGWDYFSAVCWFTARDLFELLGGHVPVGAISQNYGGTSIQFWMSQDAIAASDAPPATQCCGQNGGASCLWNTQVHPYTVGPMALTAIVWYQGEQNADCGGPYQPEYNRMLLTMVEDWRAKFQQPGLVFGNCLLAAWKSENLVSFPLLRLAQANVTVLPATFLVSAIDRGDPQTGAVHSPYKQDVGTRAANGIAEVALDKTAPYLAPTYAAATASRDGSVSVEFAAAGLYGLPVAVNETVRCPAGIPPSSCEAFAILAHPSCTWVQADASRASSGSAVVLRAASWPQGQTAVATRGYFANWPVVTVANQLGTPATPWLERIHPGMDDQCPLTPPPAGPCNTSAPAGYTKEAQQGWWANYTLVGEKYGTVEKCALACNAYGDACRGIHVWKPCPGDCYVFLHNLTGFAPHPGAFAYRRNVQQ